MSNSSVRNNFVLMENDVLTIKNLNKKFGTPVLPRAANTAESRYEKPWSKSRFVSLALLSLGALALWAALFGLGLLVPSTNPLDYIRNNFSWRTLNDWRILAKTVVIYTPTNLLFLTCLSSYIGGCASTVFYVNILKRYEGRPPVQYSSNFYFYETPFSAMLRGFPVYLAFLATAYVTSNEPFKGTTPEQYVRIAALTGILSFAVGYDPRVLKQVLMPFLPRQREGKTGEDDK
jgi:hypothetical protein